MDELNKTAERNTELEARIGFMLSSRQVSKLTSPASCYTTHTLNNINNNTDSN